MEVERTVQDAFGPGNLPFGEVYGTWTNQDCNFHVIPRNRDHVRICEVGY